jgi:hypothetical protein
MFSRRCEAVSAYEKDKAMNRQTILSLLTCLIVLLTLDYSSKLEAQDSCQPVFDALTKVVTTPSHSYSTHTSNGKPNSGEVIYTQRKVFVRVNGKWMKSPEDPKQVLGQEAEDRKHGTATCQIGREESVNGQRATVYSLHSKTENATEEAEIWIAKGTGRALREEIEMDVSGGAMGKSHVSIRYEYGNIQPPM